MIHLKLRMNYMVEQFGSTLYILQINMMNGLVNLKEIMKQSIEKYSQMKSLLKQTYHTKILMLYTQRDYVGDLDSIDSVTRSGTVVISQSTSNYFFHNY